jgi:hypothetical protein
VEREGDVGVDVDALDRGERDRLVVGLPSVMSFVQIVVWMLVGKTMTCSEMRL